MLAPNDVYERHRWVSLLPEGYFLGRDDQDSRSENMNAYFDGYMHSNTMLNKVVFQYKKVVHACGEAKEKEDFKTGRLELNNPYRGGWGGLHRMRFQNVLSRKFCK